MIGLAPAAPAYRSWRVILPTDPESGRTVKAVGPAEAASRVVQEAIDDGEIGAFRGVVRCVVHEVASPSLSFTAEVPVGPGGLV